MAQTAEAVRSFRGRRPGIPTLEKRLNEVEKVLQNKRIGNRRLSEMHEEALVLEHHFAGHSQNGEDVDVQIKRVKEALDTIANRAELPSVKSNGNNEAEQEQSEPEVKQIDPLFKVREIRKTRQSLLEQLQALQVEEETLYPEIGRKTVEEAVGLTA